MAFLDKLLRWKKKPFKVEGREKKIDETKSKSSALSATSHGSGPLAHVLIRPHISEKASHTVTMANQYVFEVARTTNKHTVAAAVKDLYGVEPIAVHIVSVRGKHIRFGRTQGTTKAWKKAIVTLPQGKTIDIYKQ